MLQSLKRKWESRKKYPCYEDMPSRMVVVFGSMGFIVGGGLTYLIGTVLPDFMKAVDSVSLIQWGVRGWMVTFLLALYGAVAWHHMSIAKRCSEILQQRWYR